MLLSKYDGNKMRTVVEIYDLENFEKYTLTYLIILK